MNTYQLYACQPVRDEPARQVTLIIERPLPTMASLEEQSIVMEKEASTIAAALINTLPGGVLDRLVIRLLKYSVSCLVIRHDDVGSR